MYGAFSPPRLIKVTRSVKSIIVLRFLLHFLHLTGTLAVAVGKGFGGGTGSTVEYLGGGRKGGVDEEGVGGLLEEEI